MSEIAYFMMAHVYFIHEKGNCTMFKMGYTKSIYQLLYGMRGSNVELYRHMTFSCANDAEVKVALLEARFKEYRMMGDWFKITTDQIEKEMEEYWLEMDFRFQQDRDKIKGKTTKDVVASPKKGHVYKILEDYDPRTEGNVGHCSKTDEDSKIGFSSFFPESEMNPLVEILQRWKKEYPSCFASSKKCYDFEFKEAFKKYATTHEIKYDEEKVFSPGWRCALKDQGIRFQKTTKNKQTVYRMHGLSLPSL